MFVFDSQNLYCPSSIPHTKEMSRSKTPMKTANTAEKTSTTLVELTSSSRVGQLTLANSPRTSLMKLLSFSHIPRCQFLLNRVVIADTWRLLTDAATWRLLAGPTGIEPATAGFGDRCSTKLSYSPTELPGFFMRSMLLTKPAVFFKLHPPWMDAPVFSSGIITPVTGFAFQRYLLSWHPIRAF